MAREDESEGIVLAIAGVGESYLSQQGREEGTGRSETVDAQGVIGSVLIRPLGMVDKSRGQGVQFEVTHAVGTYHHRGILLVEGIHHLLEGLGRGIEVVAVELYGEASTTVIMDGLVPTAADAEIRALGDDMDEPLVVDTAE